MAIHLVLFYTFLVIFVASAVLTLLALVGVVKIKKRFLDKLFYGLLLEVAAAIFLLFNHAVLDPFELTPHKSLESYKVASNFYDLVQDEKYDKAWGLLASDSNFKKASTLSRFRDGYTNTVRIHLLAVKPYKTDPSEESHDYIVYYVDEVDAPVIKELDDIHELTAAELPQVSIGLSSLRDRIKSEGFDPKTIDDLKMHQLFAPNRGDIARFVLRQDTGKDADHLFPKKEHEKFVQGRRVIVKNYDGTWLIRSIMPLEKSQIN